MKKQIVAIVVIAGLSIAGWRLSVRRGNAREPQFVWGEITRGTIENTLSSTGTLRAVGTVEVGTQVSGIIDRVLVDFNDNVRKNQILAILDTTKMAVAIREEESSVARAQALHEQAVFDFERSRNLYEQKLLSEQEYVHARTSQITAEVALKMALIALEKARTNLSYAVIRSPIDGKVIHRDVEQGQTVAASFSTPTLFTIAENLTRMEILALVDESDIGMIKTGQSVRFTVQAYQDKQFTGTVRQIWLKPQTVSNVVNYTVVIDASNPDRLLLPGMTATVDFITGRSDNVLCVPNSALKIQATATMLAKAAENRRQRFEQLPDSVRNRMRSRLEGRPAGEIRPPAGEVGRQRNRPVIWIRDQDHQLQMLAVRTGISDSKSTEVIHPLLTEGGAVITAINNSKSGQAAKSSRSAASARQPVGMPSGRPPF